MDLIEAGELTDDAAGCENDDENEDDEDVLMFLPSNAFDKASELKKISYSVSFDNISFVQIFNRYVIK